MVGVLLIAIAVCVQPDAPTPLAEVEEMLSHVQPTKDDVLYDLGCGDGRVCVMAAKLYGCRAVGVDYDLNKVRLARQVVRMNNVSPLVKILHGDVRQVNLDEATVVYVYLPKKILEELTPRFQAQKALLVVSYMHRLPMRHDQQHGAFHLYCFGGKDSNGTNNAR